MGISRNASVLIFLIAVSYFLFGLRSMEPYKQIDFRNLYLGGVLYQTAQNPYVDTSLKAAWDSISNTYHISKYPLPGYPDNFLVYPPSALLLYLPFAQLNWLYAAILNTILLVLSMFGILFFWLRIFKVQMGSIQSLLIMSMFLFFKGTDHSILVGQPTVFLFFIASFTLYLYIKGGNRYWVAILLALVCVKPTLAFPFLCYFLYTRNWFILFAAGIIQLLLSALAEIIWSGEGYLHQSFFENINYMQSLRYTNVQNMAFFSVFTDSTQLLRFYFDWPVSYFGWIQRIAVLLFVVWFMFFKRNLNMLQFFSITMVFALAFTYHLYYDGILLLPLFIWLVIAYKQLNVLVMAMLAIVMLPINGILNRIESTAMPQVLYMHMSIALLCLFIWCLAHVPKHSDITTISS
jgi:hypothetical protein